MANCKAVLKGRGFNPPLRSAHFSDEGRRPFDEAERVKRRKKALVI
jgi:hypothetical protein